MLDVYHMTIYLHEVKQYYNQLDKFVGYIQGIDRPLDRKVYCTSLFMPVMQVSSKSI